MPTESWTKWRGKPVVPENYEDVAALVRVARRARNQIVEFDWTFSEADLRRLREAVHHWSSGVVGRYKCFYARVVAAINTALEEHDTVFFINEPKNMKDLDCKASCEAESGAFHLRGHASFDIVIAFGVVDTDAPDVRLGHTVAATLTSAVRMLGWDLDRMGEPRLRPVWNALFGFPPNAGITDEAPHAGPPTDVPVHFHGPFTAVEGQQGTRCLFADPLAAKTGVYLWTVSVLGQDRPLYIGQTTRGFGQRIGEHVAGMLSGKYQTMDATALSNGKQVVVWRGDTRATPWPQAFLKDYERLAPHIVGMVRQLRFFVAPLDGDEHLGRRVEGTLGRHLKVHEDREVRGFFGAGVQLPTRIPYDKPLRIVLTSESPIAGLPSQLFA